MASSSTSITTTPARSGRCYSAMRANGPRGQRVEAPGQLLQSGAVEALDQGQKPELAGYAPGKGSRVVRRYTLARLFRSTVMLMALSVSSSADAPRWLGRLPEDAPPRPGTPQHEAWTAQRDEEAARPKIRQQQPTK